MEEKLRLPMSLLMLKAMQDRDRLADAEARSKGAGSSRTAADLDAEDRETIGWFVEFLLCDGTASPEGNFGIEGALLRGSFPEFVQLFSQSPPLTPYPPHLPITQRTRFPSRRD